MVGQFDTDSLFIKATEDVFTLNSVSDKNKLLLYGLYKQSNEGNNRKPPPSIINFKAHSKWQSWKQQAGKGKQRCKKEYIQLVTKLRENQTKITMLTSKSSLNYLLII